MIVARNSQIAPQTGHDQDLCPNCLNVQFRHNGITYGRQADSGRDTTPGHQPDRPGGTALPRSDNSDRQRGHNFSSADTHRMRARIGLFMIMG